MEPEPILFGEVYTFEMKFNGSVHGMNRSCELKPLSFRSSCIWLSSVSLCIQKRNNDRDTHTLSLFVLKVHCSLFPGHPEKSQQGFTCSLDKVGGS